MSPISAVIYFYVLFFQEIFADDVDVDNLFTTPETNFLDGYDQVQTHTISGSLEALKKCGEDNDPVAKRCVPYYNCDGKTNYIIRTGKFDGFGVIDIRFGENHCEHHLDVCCKIPPDEDTSTEVTPHQDGKEPVEPSKGHFCGIRYENGLDFKITGNNNEAEYGEFPWMVEILNQNFDPSINETLAVCGGSLITPIVILTGAHCVYKYKANDLKVRAGEWDTQTTKERLPYQEREVAEIIIHENFNDKNLHNDVALLILTQPYYKANNLGTICLPPQDQIIDSKKCFATGWGKDTFGKSGQYSVILKKVVLPIVPNPYCQDLLRQTRLGKFFVLDKSFTCAGGEEGIDTCTGDGGGPLVCPDPNNPKRYVQAGIVAWGIGCGEDQTPGVYVDVSKFRDWVDQQMKRLSLDTRPYYI